MSEPFLSEIKIMSFGFAPKGWALCNGQLLPINQNQALFSLLGTTYGGDGRVNFGLPNLQGRAAVHMGSGHTLGERGGEQAHTLSISEIPTHTHTAKATTAKTPSCRPGGGRAARRPYAATSARSASWPTTPLTGCSTAPALPSAPTGPCMTCGIWPRTG